MNRIKILALFGKSAGGKDYVANWVAQNHPEIHKIVMTTTRPIREKEIEDVTYHYITREKYAEKILSGEMIEASLFNNWGYGTDIADVDKEKINIGVFNINGIDILLQDERFDILPIYVKCNDKVRLQRALAREQFPDCHEICRRFLEDEKDFNRISFEYTFYDNSDGFCEYTNCCGFMELQHVKNFIEDKYDKYRLYS